MQLQKGNFKGMQVVARVNIYLPRFRGICAAPHTPRLKYISEFPPPSAIFFYALQLLLQQRTVDLISLLVSYHVAV